MISLDKRRSFQSPNNRFISKGTELSGVVAQGNNPRICNRRKIRKISRSSLITKEVENQSEPHDIPPQKIKIK